MAARVGAVVAAWVTVAEGLVGTSQEAVHTTLLVPCFFLCDFSLILILEVEDETVMSGAMAQNLGNNVIL